MDRHQKDVKAACAQHWQEYNIFDRKSDYEDDKYLNKSQQQISGARP
jgi:hypothetical protein